MRGVILAAGKGSRLNGSADGSPKCLTKVGAVTLIERQIEILHQTGVDEIAIVTGCGSEQVRQVCGQGITYVENSRYAETNSLYSLWLARPLLFEGFVVLNCDVLFHPVLLHDLLWSRYDDALLLAYRQPDDPPFGDEEMKVKVRCGRVTAMSKTMTPAEADGENVGIVKFSRDGAARLVDIMSRRVGEGRLKDWAPHAFDEFARIRPLHAIGTRGFPWIEIDFPADYQRAVSVVLPAIEAVASAPHRSSADLPGLLPVVGRASVPAQRHGIAAGDLG